MPGDTTLERHPWPVARLGGLDQIIPRSGDDLRHLGRLDRKLWVALSCPISGLEFDAKTLALMDTDRDGRVRADEVAQATRWSVERLADPTLLARGADRLALNAFADNPEGKALAAAARRVLLNLGLDGQQTISISETDNRDQIFAKTEFNGDGVITVHQIGEEEHRALVADIIACMGSVLDRSGEPGVDAKMVADFASELAAFETWWTVGEEAAAKGSDILPLGEATPTAHAALLAVQAKLADWFARCRLAAFDPRAAEPLNRDAAAYAAMASRDLSTLGADIEALPLRRVEVGHPFDLGEGINPAWAVRIEHFRRLVIVPLLGNEIRTIDETAFQAICARFAAFAAWSGNRTGARVEKLAITRIRAIRNGGGLASIEAAIAKDLAVAGDLVGLDDLDRLLRYVRDLGRLLRNFVNFSDLYARDRTAVFQAGVLYLDQRSCELCVRVQDVAAHATMAVHSKLCIVYCDCTRPGSDPIRIAAAITRGDSDYIMAGRRGIFYDSQGRDWDAIVTRFIEHPISIQQAFWSPYKKVIRLIETQIEKMAAAKEKASEEEAAAKVQALGKTAAAPAPAATNEAKKPPFDIARFAGIFAAIGLALGAAGAALGALVSAVASLAWWQQALVLPGVILGISLPSMIIAGLKLRQRTLGPLLEGSGWAINARVKITFALGRVLTEVKRLPPGAKHSGKDPYEENHSARLVAILIALLAVLAGLIIWRFVLPMSGEQAPPL